VTSDDQKPQGFRISREINLTHLAYFVVAMYGAASAWNSNDARVKNLEVGQQRQEATNGELKQGIREIGNDVKELSGSVRRIEGQMIRRGREG
jgi:hypothetical protein